MSGEKVVDFTVTVTEDEYAALIKFVGAEIDPKDLAPDPNAFAYVEAVAGFMLSKAIREWLTKGDPK